MTVLIEHFQLGLDAARQLALFEPRYNIAPTQEILAVRVEPKSGEREAAMLRWGLIPSWSKEPQGGPPMINARGETIAEKPSFRTAVRRRRCLIPADGFYEWQKSAGSTVQGRQKQPYYIHYRDNRPFAFAGLWEIVDGEGIAPAARRAHDRELHDRHHVGEPRRCRDAARSDAGDSRAERLRAVARSRRCRTRRRSQHLVVPNDDEAIIAEPVSTHVNRVANDDPRCIAGAAGAV